MYHSEAREAVTRYLDGQDADSLAPLREAAAPFSPDTLFEGDAP